MEGSMIIRKEEPWEGEDFILGDVEDWSSGDSDIGGQDPASRAQALLDQLDLLVKIEDDPFCDWYEEKPEFPLLDDLYSWSPQAASVKNDTADNITVGYNTTLVPGAVDLNQSAKLRVAPKSVYTVVENQTYIQTGLPVRGGGPEVASWVGQTPQLIQEFETVLQNTLTPPQTPPRYTDIINLIQNEGKESQKDMSSMEIDQLVLNRVESLYDGARSPGSEWSDNSTAPNSTTEDDTSFSSSESDLDWALPQKHNGRKRTITSTEEKRLRKKEQNKNAATRYRQKKKAEQEVILEEEQGLLGHNTSLKEKVTELQREIKYLKSLMRDVCRAKGLIK